MTPERKARLRRVLACRQPDLTVVTDYVHKGRNLSAIVRTADAAGAMTLHCVVDDRDFRSFRGTAMGSHNWVKIRRHPDIGSALQPLRGAGYQVVAANLEEGARDFREIDYTAPTAIVLGAERRGLSNEGAALADVHVTIPMMGMVESLNVSVAAGIILSEVQRQRQVAGLYDRVRIDRESYERLFFEWGYPKLKHFCTHYGLDYPPLDADGDLEDPAGWYRAVREQLGDRELDFSEMN